MKQTIIALVAIIVVAGGVYFMNGGTKNLGGTVDYLPWAKAVVSSNVSVLVTDTLILATSTRQYVAIVNDGAYPVYLALNGDAPSVADAGIRLNATGGSYEMIANDGNLNSGAIRAIAVGGTSIVTLTVK